ncbi:MAG: hypothetical protein H7257_04700 [Taibaiella sp.]|nr:hypothetical protein [Taibaiella sp.]
MENNFSSVPYLGNYNYKCKEQMKTLWHQLFLVHQLGRYGFEKAVTLVGGNDAAFLNSIGKLDYYTIKHNIERELYLLSYQNG